MKQLPVVLDSLLLWDGDDNVQIEHFSKMKAIDRPVIMWNDELVDFLADLQAKVEEWIPQIPISTEHKRSGQIF